MQIAVSAPVDIHALTPFLEGADGWVPHGLGSTATTPLIAELIKRGHEVSVFTLDTDVEREVILRGQRLTIYVGPYRKIGRARDFFKLEVEYLKRAIQRESPKLVHAHWTYEFSLGPLLAGANTLVTIHDLPWKVLRFLPSFYRASRLYMALQVARSDARFTAVSSDAAQHFHRYLSGKHSIQVVPNFLPLHVLEMGKSGIHSDKPEVTFASVLQGWTRTKNGSGLLQAFAEMRKILPNSRLLMMGIGYGKDGAAEKWSKARGIDIGVEFIGSLAHTEMLKMMKERVDVLVHPSRHEALSVTVMEAMAMAKPIIAGLKTPGQSFLLESGNCGSLVNIENPTAIAMAMVQMGKSAEDRKMIGQSAQRSAWSRFHPDVVVPQYEQLYAELLHA